MTTTIREGKTVEWENAIDETPTTTLKAVLITNPASGTGSGGSHAEQVRQIQRWLAGSPYAIETQETTPEIPAAAITREAVEAGAEAVLVAGGDGTVSEVARELVNKPVTLGIIPAGTFNNIARSVGLLPDLEAACGVVRSGCVQAIDVGTANDSHYFFEAAGAGIDAELFPLGEEVKSGHWSRLLEAIQLGIKYQDQGFELTFDRSVREAHRSGGRRRRIEAAQGNRIRRQALCVVVANGPFYGTNFTVAARARVNDGLLTVSIFRNFTKPELFWHFRGISKGRFRFSPRVETYSAREIRVRTRRPVPFHTDGMPLGETPAHFRVTPGALRVFVPVESIRQDAKQHPVNIRSPKEGKITPAGENLEDAEAIEAAERAERTLEESIAEVHTREEAEHTIDALEAQAGEVEEKEVAEQTPPSSPEEQAAKIERTADDSPPEEKTAAVIGEVARQIAAATPEDKPVLDEAVSQAAEFSRQKEPDAETEESRKLLQEALLHRLRPLQALDAAFFIRINNFRHTPVTDRFMSSLSFLMTGGHAWLLVPLVDMACNRERGSRALRNIALPLWLATMAVEHGIKRFFRRKRPFISLVRAIVVGSKPGSYSFPSGHSAAAFAGAILLSRHYPRGARPFFLLAGMVAFSRIYLGAHYPGDVVSGSVSGVFWRSCFDGSCGNGSGMVEFLRVPEQRRDLAMPESLPASLQEPCPTPNSLSVRRNSLKSTGFTRCSTKPASRERRRSSSMPNPLNAIPRRP